MSEVALTLVETFSSTSKGCVTNISGTLFVRQPTEESKQQWKTLNWVCNVVFVLIFYAQKTHCYLGRR